MSGRRRELQRLAGEVLETVGLDAFGIGEVARAAGIKPPSLYKHFDGIADIESALISEALTEFAEAIGHAGDVSAMIRVYREQAAARPERYRLMTTRPLDRARLVPGAEVAGMAAVLALTGETVARHPRARALWAWLHGLVLLEIDGRFPPGIDLESSWAEVELIAQRWAADTGR